MLRFVFQSSGVFFKEEDDSRNHNALYTTGKDRTLDVLTHSMVAIVNDLFMRNMIITTEYEQNRMGRVNPCRDFYSCSLKSFRKSRCQATETYGPFNFCVFSEIHSKLSSNFHVRRRERGNSWCHFSWGFLQTHRFNSRHGPRSLWSQRERVTAAVPPKIIHRWYRHLLQVTITIIVTIPESWPVYFYFVRFQRSKKEIEGAFISKWIVGTKPFDLGNAAATLKSNNTPKLLLNNSRSLHLPFSINIPYSTNDISFL